MLGRIYCLRCIGSSIYRQELCVEEVENIRQSMQGRAGGGEYCNKHSQTHQYNAPVLQTAACSCNSHAIMRHPLLLSKRPVLMNLHEKQVLFSPGVPVSARTLTCARVGVAVWYEYSPKFAPKLKVCGKPPSATTSH